MSPAELKPIVDAWGGPEKFAAMIKLKSSRIVYYWLEGKRNMSGPTEELIRSLKAPKTRKEKP